MSPALGWLVVECNHTLDDLAAADEIFLTGTAAEVIGVSSSTAPGGGQVGPVTALVEDFVVECTWMHPRTEPGRSTDQEFCTVSSMPVVSPPPPPLQPDSVSTCRACARWEDQSST